MVRTRMIPLRLFELQMVALFVACSLAGCGRSGPELAPVRGKVTLDGTALANALVSFHAEKGGRPGTGVTNDKGEYELMFDHRVKGAQVGANKVYITTMWPDGEPPPGQTDPIPLKYNTKTTLVADVKRGSNTHNFDLVGDSKEGKAQIK